MKTLKDLKISHRLAFAFSLLILLIGLMAFTGWNVLSGSEQRISDIVEHNNRKTKLANDLIDDLNAVAASVRDYLLHEDAAARLRQRERIAGARREYDAAADALDRLVRAGREKQLGEALAGHRLRVRPLFDRTLALADEGRLEDSRAFLRERAQPALDAWFADLYRMIALQDSLTDAAIGEMRENFRTARVVLFAVLAASVASGAFLAWRIGRSIALPLGHAVRIAETVASGDLRSRIVATGADETGQLMQALGTMNESLVRIVGELQQGAAVIASASTEIAAGNLDLSARTEEQAGSIEETAASMEELTVTVRRNAANAQQASEMAGNASGLARDGGVVVGQVVETMEAIDASARRIADIIGVIDGIAFQTNILALNAAVEAARAGEQGRGFAVVASEVRNLAQRSATAAREIKTLIGDSALKVASGSALVTRAGATMQALVARVDEVSGLVREISVASREQASGIEQVNQAIMQMDGTTQQNAALVEQAAAAARALNEQAGSLAALAAVFTLDRSAQPVQQAKPARHLATGALVAPA